ncbi:hypothetical protein Q8A73_012478 [Channa argus]|nr:hypothetical protein Q8A73_012478 [Channa argus]
MNKEVHLLLKARNTAFRSGDAQAYSTSRANLKRGIKKAEHCYKLKIEEHFSNSDPRRMWQGIQAISDYKTTHLTPAATDVLFLNKLNDFYAHFERDNTVTAIKLKPSSDHPPITLSTTDVCSTLSRIGAHKAAGPDNIPGRVLKAFRSGSICSNTTTINTGVPQYCVLSPFLYSLFTSDCKPVNGSNTIIKFADETTVIGLIRNNDETAYREEIQHPATWCNDSNLLLNTSKTKELIVDFRKESRNTHDTIHINGTAVERVSSYKFLGIHISEDLSWTINTSSLVKKAHQRLFFLRTLKKTRLSSDILVNFYRCAIESILTNCVTVWYGSCTVAERKALQRVVKTAQRITGTTLPAMDDVQRKRCLCRAHNIYKDSSHPAHRLITLLPPAGASGVSKPGLAD